MKTAKLLILGLALGSCQEAETSLVSAPPVEELPNPSGGMSGQPNLSLAPDGTVLLSWIEPVVNGGSQLLFAMLGEAGWSEPRTIAEGDRLLANWADFPSLVRLPDGRLVAHYLERDVNSAYAYGVRIVQSHDEGVTWSQPVTPHRTTALAEYGFLSLFPDDDGNAAMIWLDGRWYDPLEGGREQTSLRFTRLSAEGALGPDQVVDDRVCECCQTSVALTRRGPVAVYRDRTDGEVRDISLVRYESGTWTPPRLVHRDDWHIEGCPVNGPAVAASEDLVAVAWFTAARDTATVYVAFSSDAGETFSSPIRIDEDEPAGRVGISLLDDGSAAVVWLERGATTGEVRYRLAFPDGTVTASALVGVMGAETGSGFPRVIKAGGRLVFAWTEAGERAGVRTALAYPPR